MNLQLQEIQIWINIAAIILGPVTAVCITLWIQSRKEKRESKNRVFLLLMAHRKTNPPTFEWANALNVVDVVFADVPGVVRLWHDYYAQICSPNVDWHNANHKYIEMLHAMARTLGYNTISQTDIDKFYSPQAHGNQAQLNVALQIELLRVLKNTDAFLAKQRDAQVK